MREEEYVCVSVRVCECESVREEIEYRLGLGLW